MIKSFLHKGLEKYHYDGTKKGIQTKHAVKLADILDLLESATVIEDMNQPGYSLHLLEPKSKNRWAVKVSGNWRVKYLSKSFAP
ncbi:MAG: Killer protein [Desulfobacteraceae bacterium]|nr:Killer protein [Desulfobacteraceae bacterium]